MDTNMRRQRIDKQFGRAGRSEVPLVVGSVCRKMYRKHPLSKLEDFQ